MATNDDKNQASAETLEEIKGRRLVGLSRAQMELSPPLEWLGAEKRIIQPDDVGKTAFSIISELVEERYQEIERGE